MGDATSGPVRLSFNPQLGIEFRGATVTSDAGLLLPRELDERLGLDALIERHLTDPRTAHNRQFPVSDLFRQSIYSRLAGYEDINDAERLAEDPTFRMLASRERRETSVALQRLFKTGARLIRHARYFTLQLAESYLTRSLFRQILGRIERLAWHPTRSRALHEDRGPLGTGGEAAGVSLNKAVGLSKRTTTGPRTAQALRE